MRSRALALLDIDGTLLRGSPTAHVEALMSALAEVYGVEASARDVAEVGPGGRTDREIARLVLRRHGLDDGRIDLHVEAWLAAADAHHARLAAFAPAPEPMDDAAAALDLLAAGGLELGLLTGNIERIAWRKLARAGLADRFRAGFGAFGSDHESRPELARLARARAGRDLHVLVVIGDTPRDVECARAARALSIAVATGPFAASALRAADAVTDRLEEAARVAVDWAAQAPRATSASSPAIRARSG